MNMFSNTWSEQYLRECVADEIALAHIHPKHRRRFIAPGMLTQSAELVPAPSRGNTINPGRSRLALGTTNVPAPPRWRRDFAAAFHLHVELGLSISHDQEEGTVSVGTGSRRRNVTEAYADHPDKDAATAAAIVRAAIQFITEARE